MNNPNIDVSAGDEIVIVIPEDAIEGDEIEIDLDALGIDVEALGDDVNIVIQVEGAEDIEDEEDFDDEYMDEPNEWYFDDDPYGVVYYEFPIVDDD